MLFTPRVSKKELLVRQLADAVLDLFLQNNAELCKVNSKGEILYIQLPTKNFKVKCDNQYYLLKLKRSEFSVTLNGIYYYFKFIGSPIITYYTIKKTNIVGGAIKKVVPVFKTLAYDSCINKFNDTTIEELAKEIFEEFLNDEFLNDELPEIIE